jgi:hypothetical protein
LDAPFLAQGGQLRDHVERRPAGVANGFGVVQRRVPERHDAVAYVFVDGTARVQDDRGHGRQEAVDETRRALGVELLENCRKAANVAE